MRERVQVQAPQRAQDLQVVARPGATSAGAPRVGVSRGEQLARSLSAVEPELGRYLQEAQVEYETREAERAYDTLQGMTFAEARTLVDSGQLRETENPWYEAAFQKQFGVAYAGHRRREIMLAYDTQFDKHNGNIERFIADYVQQDAQRYGQNRFVAAGLREGMGDFLTRLRDQHAEFRSSVVQATTVDQFRGAASTAIDQAVAEGSDPAAAARGLYEQHRTAFGLTYQQMDDNILALAEQYAEAGDVATVRALLETSHTGADGVTVGSFTSRARYADQANTIINNAQATRGRLDRENSTSEVVGLRTRAGRGGLTDEDRSMINAMQRDGLISQEMRESLLVQDNNARQGALNASFSALQESSYKDQVTNAVMQGQAFAVTDYTYTDQNGRTRTISRDEVVNEVVNDTLTGMAREGYSENEMAATLASWAVGTRYQVWENALSDGYLAINQTLAQAGENGEITLPPAAMAGYGTWRNLSEHPNLRARHVTDSTALNLYRDAEALEMGGMEPETALIQAARIDRNDRRSSLSSQLDRNEFNSAVKAATSGGWFSEDMANAGWASSTIERSARILIDSGLPQGRAIEQAVRMFEESHANINGMAINTRNNLVPPNFGTMAEMVIDDFALAHDADPNDLTLAPSGSSQQSWVVVYKDTLMPHEEWSVGGAFNVTDLQEQYLTFQEQASADRRERANEAIERSRSGGHEVTFEDAQAAFDDLPERHQRNIRNTSVTSPAYRQLQERFGVEMYPDGGFLWFSPEARNGVPFNP